MRPKPRRAHAQSRVPVPDLPLALLPLISGSHRRPGGQSTGRRGPRLYLAGGTFGVYLFGLTSTLRTNPLFNPRPAVLAVSHVTPPERTKTTAWPVRTARKLESTTSTSESEQLARRMASGGVACCRLAEERKSWRKSHPHVRARPKQYTKQYK